VPDDERGELREVFVSAHRIIYRIKGDDVEIAAIVHGARLLTDLPDPQQ
jgi:plasmid stabilization system protein ParE